MSTVTLDGVTRLGMLGEATFSGDRAYRYHLARRWDRALDSLPWVALNPSTADHETDDAMVTRCCVRALRAGYGGIDVFNLFALRSTDPARLARHPDPVGPDNDAMFVTFAESTGYGEVPVIVAWGSTVPPRLRDRPGKVLGMLAGCRLLCLGTTRDGSPRHPGRLGYDVPFVPFPQETA